MSANPDDKLTMAMDVRVKALVWRKHQRLVWSASSDVGISYQIEETRRKQRFAVAFPSPLPRTEYFAVFEDAVAAAQADYTARILFALEPSPSAERMREARAAVEALEVAIRIECQGGPSLPVSEAWDRVDDALSISPPRENERLREALQPFVDAAAELFNEWCPDETPAWYHSVDGFDAPSPVTVGDFRNAARALTNHSTQGDGK